MPSSNNPGSSSNPQDPSQSPSFKRWLRTVGLVTGLTGTQNEQMVYREEHSHKICEKWKAELVKYSPAVTFMLKHLEVSGCAVPSQNLVCQPCYPVCMGRFNQEGVISLCQSFFTHKKQMEEVLTHELLHMYDQCRFKVDWSNLRHHACSEIRASNLSRECRYMREIQRGHLAFSKHHQECVRRRAALSVQASPVCPDKETADRVVNEVWESCFNDTRPFDEIY